MAEQEHTERIKIVCPSCGQKLDVTGLEPFERLPCPSCRGEVVVPRVFGDFVLEEPVGAGRVTEVFRALHVALDREAAIKLLRQELCRPEAIESFLESARRMARVQDPHVIPIYSCARHAGIPYLVTEFMGGGSLLDLVRTKGGGLPATACIRYIRDAARGLQAAARHGLVHGAVHPANILLDLDGNVKIGDFGLVNLVSRSEAAAATGVKNPPLSDFFPWVYAAPELLRGEEADERADVFGLGATLYHLLTGVPPWKASDREEVVAVRKRIPHPPLPAQGVSMPPGLGDLIRRMLAPAPADRPSDYQELVVGLNQLLRRIPSVEPGRRSAPSSREVQIARARLDSMARPRRHPAERVVNALLAVGLAFVAAAFVFGAQRRAAWYERCMAPVRRVYVRMVSVGRDTDNAVHTPPPPAAQEPTAPQASRSEAPPQPPAAGTSAKPETESRSVERSAPASPVEPRPEIDSARARPAGRSPTESGDGGAASHKNATQTSASNRLENSGRLTTESKEGPGSLRVVRPDTRPRPADLDFSPFEAELNRYLALQPADVRAVEKKRIRMIRGVRDYLIRLMKYMPYPGSRLGVRLRDGRELRGDVPLCNDREIIVRRQDGRGRSEHIAWKDLAFEQYVQFLDYYARLRLSHENPDGRSPGGQTATEAREAAEDMFRIALLCDWYGEQKLAEKYADEAIRLAPDLAARIRRYVPTRAAE